MARVELAIYDLSMGLARSMSASILGPEHALDIIPHSGIVVYGREYYFGGGIQNEDPMAFRRSHGNIQPVQTLMMGTTSKSRHEFDRWCRQNAQRFSALTYNLFNHNCNNFAHEALIHGLGMSTGVPQWVLDVPDKVRRSPMGSLIVPMLEGMQMSGASVDPFGGGGGGGNNMIDSNTTTNNNNGIGRQQERQNRSSASNAGSSSAGTDMEVNPWAHIPSASNTDTDTAANTVKNNSNNDNLSESHKDKKPKVKDVENKLMKVMKGNMKYCLSPYDGNGMGVAIDKLLSIVKNSSMSSSSEEVKQQQILSLRNLKQRWVIDKAATYELNDGMVSTLRSLLDQSSPSIYSFIIARHVFRNVSNLNDKSIASNLRCCLSSCAKFLISANTDSSCNPAVRGIAWMAMNNAFAFPSFYDDLFAGDEQNQQQTLVDNAITLLTGTRSDLKQCASLFLFNCCFYTIASAKDNRNRVGKVADLMVSLLCGVLEAIEEESCEQASVVYRILVPALLIESSSPFREICTELLVDLGYIDIFKTLNAKSNGQTTTQQKINSITQEIVAILS